MLPKIVKLLTTAKATEEIEMTKGTDMFESIAVK